MNWRRCFFSQMFCLAWIRLSSFSSSFVLQWDNKQNHQTMEIHSLGLVHARSNFHVGSLRWHFLYDDFCTFYHTDGSHLKIDESFSVSTVLSPAGCCFRGSMCCPLSLRGLLVQQPSLSMLVVQQCT